MVLSVDAAIEGTTGLALILFPGVVIWLLFATELSVVGLVLARLVGVALLALSLGCWLGRRDQGATSTLASMLLYNILTTAYFASLGVRGEPWALFYGLRSCSMPRSLCCSPPRGHGDGCLPHYRWNESSAKDSIDLELRNPRRELTPLRWRIASIQAAPANDGFPPAAVILQAEA
jgi:hypothetical protein